MKNTDRSIFHPLPLARPLLLLSLGIGMALVSGCSRQDEPENPPSSEAAAPSAPQSLTIRNEEMWMVESIVGELAALGSFACDREAAPLASDVVTIDRVAAGPSRYRVRVVPAGSLKPVEVEVALDPAAGSIWNPDRYASVATAFLTAWGVPEKAAASSGYEPRQQPRRTGPCGPLLREAAVRNVHVVQHVRLLSTSIGQVISTVNF